MRTLFRFIKVDRLLRDEKGGTLAELAILVPMLVVMLAAVTEIGRLFQTYTALSKSTRSAARYLSNHPYDEGPPVNYIAQGRNMALCGQTDCTGKEPLVAGLESENIEITAETPGGIGNPTTVSVRIVNYTFQPIFNLGALMPVANRFTTLPVTSGTTMYYMWIDPAGARE